MNGTPSTAVAAVASSRRPTSGLYYRQVVVAGTVVSNKLSRSVTHNSVPFTLHTKALPFIATD